MKTLTAILLLLFVSARLLAPNYPALYVERSEPVKPFESIWKAVCIVESNGNPLAWNEEENSIGIVQIRECKVADYNRLTGSNIKHEDCYSVAVSKAIFMWHMDNYGAYRIDEGIRRWNGSGKQTDIYLEKVKQIL